MKFKSVTELRNYLWEKLNLKDRAIIFHVIDADDDIIYFRPDLIDSQGDLYLVLVQV